MPNYNPVANSALTTLIILQVIMLAALFAAVAPHPPAIIAPFAMAPFLAASLCVAAAAMILGPLNGPYGRGFSLLAAVMAMVSYGPQKYFDPAFAQIWPAVVAGQVAVAILALHCLRPNPKAVS